MPIKLYDLRMWNGSRSFIDFRETVSFERLRDHAATLEGAKITGVLTDWITEIWLDFKYRGHKFSINNQFGEYWFFVKNPQCPDEIMVEVAEHFQKILEE